MSAKVYIGSPPTKEQEEKLRAIIIEMRSSVAEAREISERSRWKMRQIVAQIRRDRGE
ncbi:MAG: hypothetical protein V4664_02090 [Patescibacteria group bacterium]